VLLAELPLTANGKVDRRALPAPEQGRPRELVYAEPVTELERMIAAVWGELLNLERVGLEDNFFDLGGYSLLLVKAHDRITSALGKEISILEMFTYPTVQSLANHLSQTIEEETGLLRKSYSRAEARKSSRMQRRTQTSSENAEGRV
jgi:acyl carrier protein